MIDDGIARTSMQRSTFRRLAANETAIPGIALAGAGFGTAEPRWISCCEMADALRTLSADTPGTVHPDDLNLALGMADIAAVLFTRHFKFDPYHPCSWSDRDRFVHGSGRRSLLLRALLHLAGHPRSPADDDPEIRLGPHHGPAGQGLANAVGMALAERMLATRYGQSLANHHTYVITPEDCLLEGISHEAISLAGYLRLNRLIVLLHDSADDGDPMRPPVPGDHLERFVTLGWSVHQIDGHHYEEIDEALDAAHHCHRPSLIVCRTQMVAAQRGPSFGIADPVRRAWRTVGERGAEEHANWNLRLAATDEDTRNRFLGDLHDALNPNIGDALQKAKRDALASGQVTSTRDASRRTLDILLTVQSNLIGGSTDCPDPDDAAESVSRGNFSHRHIRYGVRKHGMAAIMNGMALHGGFIPCSETALAFSDYGLAAIRLAASMRLRLIYIMNDSAGNLHGSENANPAAEHLAALRTIPNLLVLRPADAVETAEAWEVALHATHTPSVLCLSALDAPLMRSTHTDTNRVARGGYVLHHASRSHKATLLASGTEVSVALEAARLFSEGRRDISVVSMPCPRLFAQQSPEYQERVLGSAPRFAIEAGVRDGWDRWIGMGGDFIGSPGATPDSTASTAPDAACDITAQHVVAALRRRLGSSTLL